MSALFQIALLLAILALVHVPLGGYLARTFTSPNHLRVERALYRVARIDPDSDQRWSAYLLSVLGISMVSVLALYAMARESMSPLVAWNTAVSFVSNTNWQAYSGEDVSIALQAVGLTVQNFLSAAVGLAVAIALIRGLARSSAGGHIGNFWVDLTRSIVRILLPLAFVSAIILIAMGVVQNLEATRHIATIAGGQQDLPGGLTASQESIKLLGTNGGGYFGANSAHPFENPSPTSNLFEIFLLLLIPSALPRTFGLMVGDRRQGWAVLTAMSALWAVGVGTLTWAELSAHGAAAAAAGGAMEGKEVRFGEAGSALFAAVTTLTSTGATNAAHDSLTAAGGGVAMVDMMLGEVSPGGVGSGLYGMLILAIVTVFLAGLMVGRTPEYLGKKIRQKEMTLVALYVLVVPAVVLTGTAIAIATPAGRSAMQASGPHGFSEVLYAFTSAGNNNGSAFGGLTATGPLYTIGTSMAMLIGRFVPIALVLALAGRLSAQRRGTTSVGTMPTHTPIFVVLLVGVVIVVAGLTFVPALALGPIAEALS